jgi:hypothetical protein
MRTIAMAVLIFAIVAFEASIAASYQHSPLSEIVDRPAVSTPGRDNFIAETAVKFDQLQASQRLLAREVTQLAGRSLRLRRPRDKTIDCTRFSRTNIVPGEQAR